MIDRNSPLAWRPPAPTAGGERRSSTRPGEAKSALTGLPVLSTEPLTTAEREALRHLVRALRLGAERVEEAIGRGRVEHGLEALQTVAAVTAVAGEIAVALGSRR